MSGPGDQRAAFEQFGSAIVDAGARLAARGLAHGATGNISVRLDDDTLVMTPTGARLGALAADRLSRLELDGRRIAGDRPTKEWPLHVAAYRSRPDAAAIVHLHSRHAVAAACLAGLDPSDALPTYTAYQAMRVGPLALVAFHPPGDPTLATAVGEAATRARSMLLANHGLVAAGSDLGAAVESAEEIEESCALHLMLVDRPVALVPREFVSPLRDGRIGR